MLLDARHQAVSGECDRTDSRRIGAVEYFQQGTFAAAVITQQTNAVAFFQGKGERVEERRERGINT
ncbi:hypothetical protein D3C78_1248890 [compost metagenome]